jgi:crossover junction endodeoxyribonuclease RuvC
MQDTPKKKKKHKLKKPATVPRLESNFYLICADLSLRCPGFALLLYNAELHSVSVVRMSIVDNSKDAKKSHGQILFEIGKEFVDHYLCNDDGIMNDVIALYIRERGFCRYNRESVVLGKVQGIMDFMLAGCAKEWIEISPTDIKKTLTGNGRATKEEVAIALEKYVGKLTYITNDTSDAVAAGITWLIQNNYIQNV